MRVFLVEDSPMLRERLTKLLASIEGVEIVGYAETATEAIEKIEAARPDSVVLDLALRASNGFDVLRALQKARSGAACYVLTNYPSEGFRAIAERYGARGFFDKSTEFERLRDALRAAL